MIIAKWLIYFIIGFVIGFLNYVLGYYFGKKAGTQKGMEELISIIKVYDQDLLHELSKMLSSVNNMSQEDKENAFYDYLEKHKEDM